MQAIPGSIDPEPEVPRVQVVLLVQVAATLKGSGVVPASTPVAQPVVGYPAEIQLWSAAISVCVAAGAPAGGIGLVVLIIRATETTAFVLLGSDFDGAVRFA